MSSAAPPLKLFISYAHADEEDRQRFGVHLEALKLEGYVEVWCDRALVAGEDWAREIDSRLAEADIVVLLVSADLIASRYIWSRELEQALRQEAAGRTSIVSVILGPCRWQRAFSPLASRQALPPKLDQVKSVREHPGGKDKAFDEVMEGLETLCEDIHARRQSQGQSFAAGSTGAMPARAALAPADRVRLWVGRRPWTWAAATAAVALAVIVFGVHEKLERDVAEGWRLLRIGEYADAQAQFTRARLWPGLDRGGRDVARIGQMLPTLGDEKVRREFDRAREALNLKRSDSAFAAYFEGLARFDDMRLEPAPARAETLFDQMQAAYRKAVATDPRLSEAHAGLAFAAHYACRLDAALEAIVDAERAAGDPPPARYAVERAEILLSYGDTLRRSEAMGILEARSADPLARLLQAMADWRVGRWDSARDKIADAAAKVDPKGTHQGAWMLYAPSGPWLLGKPESKSCLLRYAGAAARRLAGASSDATEWRGVADACPAINTDAVEYICAQLPDEAQTAPLRQDLRCPQPQPRAICAPPPATPAPLIDVRPPATPRT